MNLPSGKTPATNVAGHEIQQPRPRDKDWDREITMRHDTAMTETENEIEEDEDKPEPITLKKPSTTPDKTSDVKEKPE